MHTAADWTGVAAGLTHPIGLYLDGGFTDPVDGASLPVVSPRDGAVLAEVATAGERDVDRAVASARRAFDHGPWPRLHPRERAAHLYRLAELVERDRAQLATTIALEMGKPISDSYGIELAAVVKTFRWYAELADKTAGEVPGTEPGSLALVTREPIGVVAAVVPWNFPLTMAAWKLAPALAAGCTVVLKPAEQSPLSALHLAALATEAGLPEGVLGVLNGPGPVTGRALGLHPGVDVVTFTGSTEVGRHFQRYSADSNLKQVWLELGGKSPNLVFADAPDLDAAADSAAWAIFFNAGQMCTAGSRLIVQRSVADQVVRRLLERAAEFAPGDPLDPATRMGPLVSAEHLAGVQRHIERAVDDGARLRAGGGPATGCYLEPTVFDEVRPDMALAREEVFGPVLSVLTFDTVEEALNLAQDNDYGLAAAVWTRDLGVAHRTSRELKAGTVWVNCYEEGDLTVPFGGTKLSGHGRDKSAHALEKFTELKTTWIALP
ncbi:aldehyde dehydrogenase [Kutzneria viridogrisea]|uniref:Gamma-glutamyl-gamma-aminobutyraldehyde dehydrogenase n=1 Tax=Kutzneria viridogrisea TaxID=47990 RepID=A0ABR6BJW4_9PSEU|nr:gamma-glutamyl-gamma-aminobutyraldehyde dehydrogenase [Kutzneria viridogrisea]